MTKESFLLQTNPTIREVGPTHSTKIGLFWTFSLFKWDENTRKTLFFFFLHLHLSPLEECNVSFAVHPSCRIAATYFHQWTPATILQCWFEMFSPHPHNITLAHAVTKTSHWSEKHKPSTQPSQWNENLSERWNKMNSAYSHFRTRNVLCPDLDECLPCVWNGKAVKLNSMSLSEGCMDNTLSSPPDQDTVVIFFPPQISASSDLTD